MSAATATKNRTGAAPLVQEPTFKAVKTSSGNDELGALVIRRASQFEKEGIVAGTVVAQGIYESRKPSKFDPTKYDFFVRGADKTLYILNETSVLRNQMDQVSDLEGCQIRITYQGMGETKKLKPFHNWLVEIA